MIGALFRSLKRRLIVKIGRLLQHTNSQIARETLPEFGNKPKNLTIELPRRISGSGNIFIGDNVSLGPNALLTAITCYPSITMRHPDEQQNIQTFEPIITIGNRVTATSNLTLAAMQEITIEDDVMFASNINITDGLHGYDRVDEPYKYQPMCQIAPIIIKRGCWIGQNVVILPGVTIGEMSIIGANSVVTNDVPDRSIAFGAPARVTKKWDDAKQKWIPVK